MITAIKSKTSSLLNWLRTSLWPKRIVSLVLSGVEGWCFWFSFAFTAAGMTALFGPIGGIVVLIGACVSVMLYVGLQQGTDRGMKLAVPMMLGTFMLPVWGMITGSLGLTILFAALTVIFFERLAWAIKALDNSIMFHGLKA